MHSEYLIIKVNSGFRISIRLRSSGSFCKNRFLHAISTCFFDAGVNIKLGTTTIFEADSFCKKHSSWSGINEANSFCKKHSLWSGINEADSFCCFSVFFISISIPSGDISAGVQRIKQSAGKAIVSQWGKGVNGILSWFRGGYGLTSMTCWTGQDEWDGEWRTQLARTEGRNAGRVKGVGVK